MLLVLFLLWVFQLLFEDEDEFDQLNEILLPEILVSVVSFGEFLTSKVVAVDTL